MERYRKVVKGRPCYYYAKLLCKSLFPFNGGAKAELLQLNRTQFLSLGIFVTKKVGNQKN
jgi:hypothetical protein